MIPVITIEYPDDSIRLGQALMEGGLPCAEITYRTTAAKETIKRIANQFSELIVGAGTVQMVEQAGDAVDAGARFIVSPGFDPEVVNWCLEHGVPVVPGVATPTEINMALAKGLTILKFFPAEALGGIRTLKAISAPYPNIKFIPTGGIDQNNLADYLSLPMVHACGGSWLVDKRLIARKDFGEITRLTQEAITIINHVRK